MPTQLQVFLYLLNGLILFSNVFQMLFFLSIPIFNSLRKTNSSTTLREALKVCRMRQTIYYLLPHRLLLVLMVRQIVFLYFLSTFFFYFPLFHTLSLSLSLSIINCIISPEICWETKTIVICNQLASPQHNIPKQELSSNAAVSTTTVPKSGPIAIPNKLALELTSNYRSGNSVEELNQV